VERFYGDLAAWWPLISPVDEYEEEAAFAATVLQQAALPVRDVLELGSGGGHIAFHLKRWFSLTLTDLSDAMLDASRVLNPECEHRQGDMRTLRLDRRFDAVLVHDAVDYMTTEDDLRDAMVTAFEHCRPGGLAVFVPDHTTETFEPDHDVSGGDGDDGRSVRFLEWTRDPDPDDTWVETDYVFVLRDGAGLVDVVHETHRTGLFPTDTWVRLLAGVGFEPELVPEVTSEDRPPRTFFAATRRP
jgi:trans-aconitate methyltransferase